MIKINRKFKKNIFKLLLLIFILMILYILGLNYISNRARNIIKANIKVEQAKIENAIKEYKLRTGENPNLQGNENNLQNVKNVTGSYTFDLFYGSNKLFEIPENLQNQIIKTNKITTQKDNKGGWFYNVLTGEIKANIEEKNNKSTK